jgi:hypothetical protein
MLMMCSSAARAELVGWWTFDDITGDTVPDSSGFMNTGTMMAGATTSDDVPTLLTGGRSLALGGFDDHVLVEDNDSLDILEAITIAAWVKPIGNIEWDAIVAKSPSDDSGLNHAGNYELRIENGTRTLTFLNQQGGIDDTIPYGGGPSIADSVWQHVAVTVDEDGVTFFRDGLLQSTRPLGGAMFFGEPNSNPLYIGSRADLFTTMDGLIDDLRIYNTVLTPEDIRTLAGADPPPPPPANLLPATIHSVSSELVTSFQRGADNIVNGNGLNPDGTHSIGPDGNMWLNAGNGCCGDETDPLGPGAEIVFDMGSVVSLDSMKVWNYNENLPGRDELLLRGVALADILVAGEDLNFSTFASEVEFELAPGDDLTEFGQVIDMAGANARYVKLSLLSNHGGDNDFLGLSEVQFFERSLNGDFNGDGVLDAQDIDLLSAEVRAGTNGGNFDLNSDGVVTDADRGIWIEDIKKVWRGDADLNGLFNSSDFVQVFQRGQYEDAVAGNSGWGEGDWTGDGDFNSSDLVAAFQEGGFEGAPRPASGVQSVPEPASGTLLLTALLLGVAAGRRRV